MKRSYCIDSRSELTVIALGVSECRDENRGGLALRIRDSNPRNNCCLFRYWLMLLSKILETLNQLWDSFLAGEIPLIVVELCGWDVQSLDDKRLCAPV